MTTSFSLQETSIRLTASGMSIPFTEIQSIEIFEGIRISKKKFMIAYWVVWGTVVVALWGGNFIELHRIDSSTMTTSALIVGLGLLAQNPIYNMFPSGTFLRLWYHDKNIDLEISELTTDDRIHTLIGELRRKVGERKIKIIK